MEWMLSLWRLSRRLLFGGLPFTHLTTETGFSIGNEFGRVLEVDSGENQLAGYGFVRLRVVLQIEAPLRPGFPLLYGKEKSKVTLKYGNLPNFCLWCGFLSHVERHCPLMKKDNPSGEEPLRFDYKELRAKFLLGYMLLSNRPR